MSQGVPVPSARVAVFMGAIAAGLAAPAWGHARVVQADPVDGAVLAAPPSIVHLRFDEAIEPAFTKLQLRDAAGKPVAATPPAVVEVSGSTAALPMPASLGAGRYTVHWSTVGPDGHRVQGDLHFVVK